ncbi:F-box/LRR-repeat protein At3g26922-like [Rhodamnia argentea]|uniref:F-box/LRR-repeat protein At3g26922-like n=1 Tax=Rhodamnia argentea TaxID=178133 RepID=A0ABM3H515_9MYRT|nr:F-box/LRR-repeat protein At3g26922-like [Rhodamnia argentea]
MCCSLMNDGAFRALDKPVRVMDETAAASKSKHRKLNEEQDMDSVACNIDDLPEAILEHILSFVPIEDAVATCVLSKKWRYLWTSHPNLELFESRFSGREHFTNFVDGVLLQGSSRIKKLVLRCSNFDYASRINFWVSTAVARKVESCSVLLLWIPGNLVLPYCLFSCATLARLELCVLPALELPSRIWLPNLKFLLLKYFKFVDERSTEQLLSSPALEELIIEECNWSNIEALTIRPSMLKILTIHDDHDGFSLVHPYGCRVLICGNNLERILCRSSFLNDYRFEKSCSLLEACINVTACPPSRTRQVARRLHKLLEATCSVKKLTLSSTAVRVLSSAAELCSHLPIFPNLKLLVFGRLDLKHQAIVKLLHNSPDLETLEFREGIQRYGIDDGYDAILDPAPHCFGSHLKQIELHNVLMGDEVVRMLELLLKHAMVLEKLLIHHRRTFSWLGFEESYPKTLPEVHCGSKSFKITILPPDIDKRPLS